MANGKVILLFFIMLNLISVSLGVASGNSDVYSEFLSNNFQIQAVRNPGDVTDTLKFNGGLNGSLATEYDQITNQDTGLLTTDLFKIVDAIKLVIGVISVLTPFPFMAILLSFNMYWLVELFLGLPLIVLWLFGFVEFLRGVNL